MIRLFKIVLWCAVLAMAAFGLYHLVLEAHRAMVIENLRNLP